MRLLACLLLLVTSATTAELRYFQYERPILGTPQVDSQTCLSLDANIFAHAARGLADVRLYRDGSESPYRIRLAGPSATAERPVSPLNLGLRGKQTVFDAYIPDANYSDVDLNVDGQDFIATVTVSGGRRQTSAGETRLGSYTIFDLTRQKLGRSTVLHLPESDFRYLHFEIAGPIPPEQIKGLTIEREPDKLLRYETLAQSSQASQKDRSTVFDVTVPAHVPVDRLVVVPGSQPAMFSRNVRIAVQPIVARPSNDDVEGPPAPSVTNGNLLRLHSTEDGHRIDEERLAIDTPSTDFDTPSKWTISIENGDDAPIEDASVRLEMVKRELCFQAAGNARYTLYYGDAALSPPVYDYAVLFTTQPNESRATAAPEQRNPIYQARPDKRPFTERHPALLWAALIAVILVLGGIALRSSTRTGGPRVS